MAQLSAIDWAKDYGNQTLLAPKHVCSSSSTGSTERLANLTSSRHPLRVRRRAEAVEALFAKLCDRHIEFTRLQRNTITLTWSPSTTTWVPEGFLCSPDMFRQI